LTLRSGLVENTLLHCGQKGDWCLDHEWQRQVLQKLCPHGMVTGLTNTSRHSKHRKDFSHSRLMVEAMIWKTQAQEGV